MKTNEREAGRRTVLVVDDDRDVRRIVKTFLGTQPHLEVLEASDGLEGIDVLLENPVDLLIVDLHMPRMNGLEMVAFVRNVARTCRLPVVMFTTAKDDYNRRKAMAQGVDFYVNKPFDPGQFAFIVKHLLPPEEPPAASLPDAPEGESEGGLGGGMSEAKSELPGDGPPAPGSPGRSPRRPGGSRAFNLRALPADGNREQGERACLYCASSRFRTSGSAMPRGGPLCGCRIGSSRRWRGTARGSWSASWRWPRSCRRIWCCCRATCSTTRQPRRNRPRSSFWPSRSWLHGRCSSAPGSSIRRTPPRISAPRRWR
ncbi:MAG: response regulator [Candidatus Riflebacteria bacterium]|nr:response regulator [Candidatus Riflebacteria bacterium]